MTASRCIEAKKWSRTQGSNFLTFEEGYFRTYYITLEKRAVKGLLLDAAGGRILAQGAAAPTPWKPSTDNRAAHALIYYAAGWFGRHSYPGYRHHKSFSPWYEMRCWLRAGCSKVMYCWQQRQMLSHIAGTLDNQY